jgi:hypothetical protein
MPFLSGPPAPKPKDVGICTPCGESRRVWKFAEQEVSLTAGYSAVLSYAICRACLEVVLELLDAEDDDDAGLASDPPG